MSADIKVTDGTILEALNNKVDIDFDNVASNSVSFARMSREVTNCITEIPQRIKYTLEDGTLTIKAGSVVIVPYGIEDLTSQYPKGIRFLNDNFIVYDTQYADGKFFVWAESITDLLVAEGLGSTNPYFITKDFNDKYNVNFESLGAERMMSGSQAPSAESGTQLWYNTTDNTIRMYGNGIDVDRPCCLPLCIAVGNTEQNPTGYTSVQVFNGIGYIGSTVWVDKGVRGLIPNGRNEDGTLKNIEWTNNSIKTCQTHDSRVTESYIDIETDKLKVSTTRFESMYDKEINHFIYDNSKFLPLVLGSFDTASGTKLISNFQPKQPFRAIDYSDKSEVSGWGMPSNKHTNLTLGASGATYTAPANGWMYLVANTGTDIQMYSLSGLGLSSAIHGNNNNIAAYLPCKKGDIVQIVYTISSLNRFEFVYAEGEV